MSQIITYEKQLELNGKGPPPKLHTSNELKSNIKWLNVVTITFFHLVALYSALIYWNQVKILTYIWGLLIGVLSGFGVTAGVHRLWSHRSYKAKLPLQIFLLICYSMAGQNSVYDWVRDHRVHHKFSETNADPHNAKRGFFFSHVGWLMCKKHEDVLKKGATVDMSDITGDPLLQFHRKYFVLLKILFCFVIPTIIPPICWNEEWKIVILGVAFVRYICLLNFTWLVNSAAHIWGNKPFDKRIGPAENASVAFLALGEGWHNYHHVFPMDYRAAELGFYSLNITTMMIDFFAKIGWAYDLKKPSQDIVQKTASKYGDGSHPIYQ